MKKIVMFMLPETAMQIDGMKHSTFTIFNEMNINDAFRQIQCNFTF